MERRSMQILVVLTCIVFSVQAVRLVHTRLPGKTGMVVGICPLHPDFSTTKTCFVAEAGVVPSFSVQHTSETEPETPSATMSSGWAKALAQCNTRTRSP